MARRKSRGGFIKGRAPKPETNEVGSSESVMDARILNRRHEDVPSKSSHTEGRSAMQSLQMPIKLSLRDAWQWGETISGPKIRFFRMPLA